MKRSRITLLAEDVEETASGAFGFTIGRDVYYVGAEHVLSVEDHIEPLPTTPGTRFWGSLDKTAPCWWFVTKERGTAGVWYVSQHGTRDRHPSGMNSTSIAATEGRLVRLPDPEVTP